MARSSLILIISFFYLCQAEFQDKSAQNSYTQKREVQKGCHIPEPLDHGKYQVNHRVCSNGDSRPACQLVPGIIVPELWVLYYSCDAEYQLALVSRASVCRGGRWIPALPVCLPTLNMTYRADWSAVDESTDFLPQELPSTRVIVAHTATGACSTKGDCLLSAQSIQQYHKQQFGDIGYNFLVGGDGSVIEGQGWHKIGAHTINYNTQSVCIALIGNFMDTPAPQAMLIAVKRLIELGVALGELSKDYKLFAHCQLIQAASPGVKVFDEIKNWPHWNAMNALRCSQ